MKDLVRTKLNLLKADIELELGTFKIVGEGSHIHSSQLLLEAGGLYYIASICNTSQENNRLFLEEVIVLKSKGNPNEYLNSLLVCDKCKGTGVEFNIVGKSNCSKCTGHGWVDWVENVTGKKFDGLFPSPSPTKIQCMTLNNKKKILVIGTDEGFVS